MWGEVGGGGEGGGEAELLQCQYSICYSGKTYYYETSLNSYPIRRTPGPEIVGEKIMMKLELLKV